MFIRVEIKKLKSRTKKEILGSLGRHMKWSSKSEKCLRKEGKCLLQKIDIIKIRYFVCYKQWSYFYLDKNRINFCNSTFVLFMRL